MTPTVLDAARRMCSRHSRMPVDVPCARCRERSRLYLGLHLERYPFLHELRSQLAAYDMPRR